MQSPIVNVEQVSLGPRGLRWAAIAVVLAVIGGVASGLIVAATDHGAARFFHSYLVNYMYFLSLGLGALFFVLISHLTRAGWNVVLRRVVETMSLTLLPMGLLVVIIVAGREDLYEWTHLSVVNADELLLHKRAYLNAPFFVGRLLFYFLVWGVIALYFAGVSRRQDRTRNPELTQQMERVAAPSMIFYAMTVTFAAFDLLMSLYPHWYSTIYGVYFFSGALVGTFALVALVAHLLRSAGNMGQLITLKHFHDVGKLMFAFVVFWAYIAFSQFMLIWYAAIPEETVWYLTRQEGPWAAISLTLLLGHFLLPFLFLMSRHSKRQGVALVLAAAWLMAMHWLDLFWLVMPESVPLGNPFDILDLTSFIAIGGCFFAVLFFGLSRGSIVPIGDPRLAESLEFEHV